MKTRNLILTLIFTVIVLVELIGRIIGHTNFELGIILEYIAKPLILIWIAIYFLLNAEKRSFRGAVLLAFFFSWLGDMLLMFSGGYDNEMFFFAGVGGFFLAQCTYIFVFLKFREQNEVKGFLVRSPLWIIPFLAFLLGFYLFLLPGLEGLMKPIILIYAISLIGMSLAALHRKGRVGTASFRWIFFGSVFFVISDGMIAINKFHFEDGFPYAGFWIMLTYIAAQYLIMRGLILEKKA